MLDTLFKLYSEIYSSDVQTGVEEVREMIGKEMNTQINKNNEELKMMLNVALSFYALGYENREKIDKIIID
tara:strand:- start:292 stop:504 length:213 start_codon:yes stop_codon:yes gene_type:complete